MAPAVAVGLGTTLGVGDAYGRPCVGAGLTVDAGAAPAVSAGEALCEGEAATLPSGLPAMVSHITLSIANVIRNVPTSIARDFTRGRMPV